jgi:hypothetical protein
VILIAILMTAGPWTWAAQTPINASFSTDAPQPPLRELARTQKMGSLVEWLRDDDIRWNATAAGAELQQRALRAANHPGLIRLLEPELNSPDIQVRKVALGVLQNLGRKGIGLAPVNSLAQVYPPSKAILQASVNILQNYTTCSYPEWIPGSASQRDCVRYLLRVGQEHLHNLQPILFQAMNQAPKHQAWIYAYLLAQLGCNTRVEQIAALLIPQLKHNYIHDDGLMCLNALYQLGPGAITQAQATLKTSEDRQQIKALKLLLFELGNPPTTPVPATPRNQLTWKCQNPIRSWRFGRNSH